MPMGSGGMFGTPPATTPGVATGGMFGGRFENPLRALAMIAGPAMMAKGFNMPGLANMGPQMLGLAQQSRQSAQEAARKERELKLKEAAAARDKAMREQVASMFGAGPAPSAAPAMAGAPGGVATAAMGAPSAMGAPTPMGAPGMMGAAGAGAPGGAPAGAPPAMGGMFGNLSDQDRQTAAAMALDDPVKALKFAAERSAPPDPTAAMVEAESLGYRPGTPAYNAYIREARLKPSVSVNMGQTGVDYGDPPKDMAWARTDKGEVATRLDPDTGFMSPVSVPIAGGPVETERAEAATAKAAEQRQREQTADTVTRDIDRALDIVETADIPVTGMGSYLSAIPGTQARDVSALVDTVKANVGFDKLQQMRAASPTGGALGQVSERENLLLQSTIANLEQSQSKEQFTRNLQEVKKVYGDIVNPPLTKLSEDQLMNLSLDRLDAGQLREWLKLTEGG